MRRQAGTTNAPTRAKVGAGAHLCILVNRDWFFLSHFLPRALTAAAAGYRVTVICEDTGRVAQVRALGLHCVPLRVPRHGASVIALCALIARLCRQYAFLQPDIVWHIGLLPIVCGTVAARLGGVRAIVNAPVGMGWAFAAESSARSAMRLALRIALRATLNPLGRSRVIFENQDDLREMQAWGAVRASDATVIRGAGVDPALYDATQEQGGVPVVLFAARLIWEKGVGEYVAAARLLRQKGVAARFCIAGGIDAESTSAVPRAQLQSWEDEGVIEWLGARDDMPQVIAACHVFCLPTWYREGLPKVILEAMACARPVVTTDTPGCREAVRHEDNGLLVAPKDVAALAAAIERLIGDAQLRKRLGERGRQRAVEEFSSERVCRETLAVFDALVGRAGATAT